MTSGQQGAATGRHSQHPGTWTPAIQYPHAPAHARIEPESLVEQTVPGLRKFDLGTVPASVTPPRSWRTAAWFAVGASLAVVVGLVFAASALMGQPRSPSTIDALPNYPSLPMLILTPTDPTATDTARPTHTSDRHTEPKSSVTATRRPPTDSSPQATLTDSATVPSAPPSPTYTPPVRETMPGIALAMNDPKEIGDRTEAFYKAVTSNPDAAYQMTTGGMRTQGADAFKARYADIKSIQVRRIGIDPNQGTTVSEVTVTKKDGTTYTEQRRLRFTSGSNPKISSEVTH
ncbi:hypothetical protein [Actinocrispum wychmicini]|nr:hypothetical protein [Actinocrispum wychmicini]